mgnify:CR=1 FL=1
MIGRRELFHGLPRLLLRRSTTLYVSGRHQTSQAAAAAPVAPASKFFPDEPVEPKVVTSAIPGPKSNEMLKEMNKIQVLSKGVGISNLPHMQ